MTILGLHKSVLVECSSSGDLVAHVPQAGGCSSKEPTPALHACNKPHDGQLEQAAEHTNLHEERCKIRQGMRAQPRPANADNKAKSAALTNTDGQLPGISAQIHKGVVRDLRPLHTMYISSRLRP